MTDEEQIVDLTQRIAKLKRERDVIADFAKRWDNQRMQGHASRKGFALQYIEIFGQTISPVDLYSMTSDEIKDADDYMFWNFPHLWVEQFFRPGAPAGGAQ